MADESCRICGQPALPSGMKERVIRIAEEKGIVDASSLLLCRNCKLKSFSHKLVGGDLRKVPRAKLVPHRRTERLEPVKQDSRLGTTVYKSECFSCNQGCDAVVHVKDGRVVRVEGDASSHVTKGILCSKGLASPEHSNHRQRILYPLKRSGKRGEGRWERISWDEGLDTIVRRLNETEEKYGKDGILLATGTSRGWLLPFYRFANAYGVQYTAPGTAQCALPRFTGSTLVGGTRFLENPDYTHTRCMLVWGANPTSTFPAKGRGMMEAWIRGAKLIFGSGPLVDTTAPGSNKMNVSTLGPMINGWASSCSDSYVGGQLKYSGYDSIVIEGKAHTPVYLWIHDDQVEIRDARSLRGKTTIRKDERWPSIK